MPFHEFKCLKGHVTEQMFLTFKAAEGVVSIQCPTCKGEAVRLDFSVPAPGMFYGNPEGYYKPSPRKRFSNKLAAQKGNSGSTG